MKKETEDAAKVVGAGAAVGGVGVVAAHVVVGALAAAFWPIALPAGIAGGTYVGWKLHKKNKNKGPQQ